jgi:DNA-binding transcriptional LysR family regulator
VLAFRTVTYCTENEETPVGRLRLGFVSTVGFGALPGWLRDFRSAAPGVAVVLREATTDVQLQAFEQGELDAGFVLHAPGLAPESSGTLALARHSLGVEPMVLAVPEGSDLTHTRRLTLKQILSQPLIIFPRPIAPSLYDAVLAFYHRHNASLAIAQEAIQMQTIVNLVSAGLGLAWVPQSVTTLQRPGVVYRRLPAAMEAAGPRAETSLVWPGDAGPVVERFVAFVAGSAPLAHSAEPS